MQSYVAKGDIELGREIFMRSYEDPVRRGLVELGWGVASASSSSQAQVGSIAKSKPG